MNLDINKPIFTKWCSYLKTKIHYLCWETFRVMCNHRPNDNISKSTSRKKSKGLGGDVAGAEPAHTTKRITQISIAASKCNCLLLPCSSSWVKILPNLNKFLTIFNTIKIPIHLK